MQNGTDDPRNGPVPPPLPRRPLGPQLMWLVPGWLYIPFLLLAVPSLGRGLSENLFGVFSTFAGGVLLLVPLFGSMTGRVSGRLFNWTFLVPIAVLMLVVVGQSGD